MMTLLECMHFVYLLWFNFALGLIFILLCFKLIIIHYHTQKQRKIKIKPRIKLNHNISIGDDVQGNSNHYPHFLYNNSKRVYIVYNIL